MAKPVGTLSVAEAYTPGIRKWNTTFIYMSVLNSPERRSISYFHYLGNV